MKPAKTKFVLVRHTTTEWNPFGKIQGQTDTQLNEQGRAEAEKLGELLADLKINLIVSSDLKRASLTAEIINQKLKAPHEQDARLRECSFGKIEGLTKEKARAKYGELIIPTWEDQFKSYDFRKFGGENQSTVLTRHLELLGELASKHRGKNVLLVGHGRGLCTLLYKLGLEPNLKRGEYRIVEY